MAQHSDDIDDESLDCRVCVPIAALREPVYVGKLGAEGHAGKSTFFRWPILGPLLFNNESSDARDHCANERTFLSYLRLSILMAVVSVAITLSFHINHKPSAAERRMAKPLGIIFWALAILTLLVGLCNYIRTVNLYSKKAAIVQSGWRTQLVLAFISLSIFATCIVLLVVNKVRAYKSR